MPVHMSRSKGYPYFGISLPRKAPLTYHARMASAAELHAKRVLIADDHPLYRDALRAIIPQAMPGAQMQEAGDRECYLRFFIRPDRSRPESARRDGTVVPAARA